MGLGRRRGDGDERGAERARWNPGRAGAQGRGPRPRPLPLRAGGSPAQKPASSRLPSRCCPAAGQPGWPPAAPAQEEGGIFRGVGGEIGGPAPARLQCQAPGGRPAAEGYPRANQSWAPARQLGGAELSAGGVPPAELCRSVRCGDPAGGRLQCGKLSPFQRLGLTWGGRAGPRVPPGGCWGPAGDPAQPCEAPGGDRPSQACRLVPGRKCFQRMTACPEEAGRLRGRLRCDPRTGRACGREAARAPRLGTRCPTALAPPGCCVPPPETPASADLRISPPSFHRLRPHAQLPWPPACP